VKHFVAEDVLLDAGRVLIAVPAGSAARSSRALMAVAVSRGEPLATRLIAPQYRVRVDVSRAGDRHMIIVGDFSCVKDCGGTSVTFSNSSGAILGMGVSNDSGRFALMVPLTSSSFQAVVGTARSNWVNAGS